MFIEVLCNYEPVRAVSSVRRPTGGGWIHFLPLDLNAFIVEAEISPPTIFFRKLKRTNNEVKRGLEG